MAKRRTYLQIALLVTGLVAILLYPLMLLWPSGWSWQPAQHEYEQMMSAVYATLGVFLLRAAREPEANLSLIWFTVWSSVVHATMMAALVIGDPAERGHLVGDIPALLIAAAVLGALTPRTVPLAYTGTIQ
jgi:hypothetical protein